MTRLGLMSLLATLAIGAATLQLVSQPTPSLLAQDVPRTPSPYAGQQNSSVRGLTEAEIDDLRNGRGMGLARPAELNGYPGPRHALDLADELALSDEQRRTLQGLFTQMKGETIPLGEQLLTRYAELESAFREGQITPDVLGAQATQLGQLEGQLRAAHLKFHLLTKPLLTDDQVAAYARLRGYTDERSPQQPAAPVEHQPGLHGHPAP